MKNSINTTLFMSVAVILAILSSCASSNGAFSKRKYTKGVHISQRKITPSVQEEVLVAEKKVNFKKQAPQEGVAPAMESNGNAVTDITEVVTSSEVFEQVENTEPKESKESHVTVSPKSGNDLFGFNNSESQISTTSETESIIKNAMGTQKIQKMRANRMSDEAILYYILAIIIPFLAVGLVTNWDITKVLITVLLCFLFWLPGVIYALITVSQNV